jgi:O-antigen ligase
MPLSWKATNLLVSLLAVAAGAGIGLLILNIPSTLVLLALAVALAGTALIIRRVEWGLLVLIFMIYTRFSDVAIAYYHAPSIAQPLLLFLLLLIFIRWHLYGERSSGWLLPAALIIVYGLVGATSLLYAADFDRALAAFLGYSKDGTIAVVIVLLIRNAATLRRAVWALLAAGIFLGTISVFQYLTGTFTNTYGGFGQAAVENIVGNTNDYRIAGPIGDPNFYAQTLVVLVPLALDRFMSEHSIRLRILAAWALIACVLSIIFTFSRGGLVALMVVAALRLMARSSKLATILILVTLAFTLAPLLPSSYADRLVTVITYLPGSGRDVREEVSFRGRASAVQVGFMMFADHPLLGVGQQNYPVLYQQYSQQLGIDPRRWDQSPHSLSLEVLAETGVVGLVAFAALLWAMFRRMRQARMLLRESALSRAADMISALSLGIGGYLAAAVFLHNAFPRFFWLLFGLALATPQIARFERQHIREIGKRARQEPAPQLRS